MTDVSSQPWCPVCHQKAPVENRMNVGAEHTVGFWQVFSPHNDGCQGSGRRVMDRDFGYRNDAGEIVPEWVFFGRLGMAEKDR